MENTLSSRYRSSFSLSSAITWMGKRIGQTVSVSNGGENKTKQDKMKNALNKAISQATPSERRNEKVKITIFFSLLIFIYSRKKRTIKGEYRCCEYIVAVAQQHIQANGIEQPTHNKQKRDRVPLFNVNLDLMRVLLFAQKWKKIINEKYWMQKLWARVRSTE